MIQWFLYQVPWWAYALIGLAILGGVQYFLGWKAASGAALGGLLLLAQLKGRQEGYADREAQGDKETNDAIAQANAARRDADQLNSDPSGLRKDDGFRRNK